MENEFLYAIAEVAAAFAGFSTLVSIVGLRGYPRSDGNVTRVVALLVLSIMVVMFGLLPGLAGVYGYADAARWDLLCFVYAVSWAAYWLVMLGSIMRGRFGVGFRQVSAANRFNLLAVHPLAIIALSMAALGAWGAAAAAVYATALMLMLLLAGFLFVQAVIAILSQRIEPD